MSPSFDVRGFGGQIVRDDADAKASPLVFSRIKTGEPWSDQGGTDLGGMRHRSAFNLVKTVPNVRAFVVSQDGDLTVLFSDERKAYCARGLTPTYGTQ